MTTVPPGWYDDGHGGMRWWDGSQWTEHVAVPQTDEPGAAVPLSTGPAPSDSPYWGGEPAARGAAPQIGHAPGDLLGGEASAPAAEPPKSRLWIVWVVFGAILLGAVLAYLFGAFSVLPSTSGNSSGDVPSEVPSEVLTDEPSPLHDLTLDEQAAVDAVVRFNDAWLTGDCDAFFETTTVELRAGLELTDCARFAAASKDFADSVDGYETVIRSVVTSSMTITVSTTEAYSSTYDDYGTDTGVPVAYEDHYEYTLVRAATNGWAIDRVI